jgi:host cell factor
MYEEEEGSQSNHSQSNHENSEMEDSQHSEEQSSKSAQRSQSSQQSSRRESHKSSEMEDDREVILRRWQWAYPIIEGVSPCQRGGHTATLSGASIVIFGGHYYTGKS